VKESTFVEAALEMKCPTCGEEVNTQMKFCPKCGAPLGMTAQPSTVGVKEKRPEQDVLGLASVGVILILIALTYIRNPISPSVIIDYFEIMGNKGTFIKPPPIFFDAGVFFLYAVGVWGIVLSGLRMIFQRSTRKSLGDLVGAFFSFFLAFILTQYANNVFSGHLALAYFVIGVGLLVIINAILHFAIPR